MKNKGLINTLIGLAVLYASVWVISRAWKKGKGDKNSHIEDAEIIK